MRLQISFYILLMMLLKRWNASIQNESIVISTTSCESLHKDLNGTCRSVNDYYEYECTNAFDGDVTKTKWIGEYNEKNNMPQISFEFISLRLIKQYEIHAGILSINLRYSWVLVGSLDGNVGVQLDRRENEILLTSKRYNFTNTKKFRHYYLIFTSLPSIFNRIEINEFILCKTYYYQNIMMASNKIHTTTTTTSNNNNDNNIMNYKYKYKEFDNYSEESIINTVSDVYIDINGHEDINIDWNYIRNINKVINENIISLSDIYPLSYSIPDELIMNEIPSKRHLWAEIIPGETLTYRFESNDEKEYHSMYQSSMFALTRKKDGWDALRHYEILANGAIPVFKDILTCPKNSLTTYPKQLVQLAMKELLPWKDNELYELKYIDYVQKLLAYTKENCSTSAAAKYFLSKFTYLSMKDIKNVLLLTGHNGINYSRETLWIGLKRYISSIGGLAIEFPSMNYLYNNLDARYNKYLYGYGYSYSMKLNSSLLLKYEESDLILSIINNHWDIIIYGRVGIDEDREGSLPNLPYWKIVNRFYLKEQIAFIYGGDHSINISNNNKYYNHLKYHCQYAKCFVRELE